MRNQCFEIITIFWHWSKIAPTYVGLICPCHSDGFLWSITFIHMLININHFWHYTVHFFRKTIRWLTGNKWKFWKRDHFLVMNRIYEQLFGNQRWIFLPCLNTSEVLFSGMSISLCLQKWGKQLDQFNKITSATQIPKFYRANPKFKYKVHQNKI